MKPLAVIETDRRTERAALLGPNHGRLRLAGGRSLRAYALALPKRSPKMTQKTQRATRTPSRRGFLNRIFTIRPTTSRIARVSRHEPSSCRRRRIALELPFSLRGEPGGWWRTGRAKVERNARMGTGGAAAAGRGCARSVAAQGAAARRTGGESVAALARSAGPSRAAQARYRADALRSPRRGASGRRARRPARRGHGASEPCRRLGSRGRSALASPWSRFPARRI